MKRNVQSRRDLLRALGAGAALLPLLEATQARGATFPKRLIVLVQTNGTLADHFFPQGGGTNLSGLTLPAITQPLEEFKPYLNFFRGLGMKNFTDYPDHGAGHENFSCTLTGTKGHEVQDGGTRFVGGGPSIDQYVADGIANQVVLPLRSLVLGLTDPNESYHHQSRCFYRGPNAPVNPETNPSRAFSSVFEGRGADADPQILRMRARRKSVLDYVTRDLSAYAKRLGTEDRQKVASHLQAVRELEQRVSAKGAAECTIMPDPGLGVGYNTQYREK
ncbi:MAG TPA: DUF1552 domain-containing protein, partial [Myxococcaceae bacterium]|nr:DUF1552 domain-containing protein [Myxococcaceae bacterium]